MVTEDTKIPNIVAILWQRMKIDDDNYELLRSLSIYLNEASDYIKRGSIHEVTQCGVDEEYAYSLLLAAALGLNLDNTRDEAFFERYFPKMIHKMNVKEYAENPFYKDILIPTTSFAQCELKHETYKPYEAFVCDDFVQLPDGCLIPQIGFFDEAFAYPAILKNGRIWMTTIPNEINTMAAPIKNAKGKVLTFGLGLGYFAYMVSEKDEVESVTVVDKDPEIIHLFETFILPQFRQKQKIHIILDDAFEYAGKQMPKEKFDYVFTDLWHDVSDGVGLYKKMKSFEGRCPETHFDYWIEKSIKCYM